MTNSAIAGNSATRGGGINNTALVRMTNSTVSGNSAHSGGGIENDRVLEIDQQYYRRKLCNVWRRWHLRRAPSYPYYAVRFDKKTPLWRITWEGIFRGVFCC